MQHAGEAVNEPTTKPQITIINRGLGLVRWIGVGLVAYVVAKHVVNTQNSNEEQ